MSNDDIKTLERLISELYDDGLSAGDMERLEELLLDNPAAQSRYRGLVDTHLALSVASSSMGSEDSEDRQACAAPPTAPRPTAAPQASPAPPAPSVKIGWAWPLATAAALLIACSLLITQSYQLFMHGAPAGVNPLHLAGMTTLPSITHVSWEGPAFQSMTDQSLPMMTVSPGAITLRLKKGKTAEGYVFCLRPRMSVDLVATFDATGENSLSIVELTGGPEPAAKKLTFHNAGDGPRPFHANPGAKNRRYGVLGHWTEANSSPVPRFFLLTGVHKLAQPEPGEEWRLSELEVLLENDDAVHIGWDDSGPAPSAGQSYQQDGDYDDLAASLFFTPLDGDRWDDANGSCDLTGDEDSRLEVPEDLDGGFAFDLPPGAIAMVKGISEATDPNGMAIIDADNNKVLWTRAKPQTSASYLGTACISNRSKSTKSLRLVAVHKEPTPYAEWKTSSIKMLYEQPRYNILGFDDSRSDKDYDDVRINLLIEGRQPASGAPESR